MYYDFLCYVLALGCGPWDGSTRRWQEWRVWRKGMRQKTREKSDLSRGQGRQLIDSSQEQAGVLAGGNQMVIRQSRSATSGQ